MASERIGNWTKEQLREFVLQVVETRIQAWEKYQMGQPSEELWQRIINDIIPTPPGVPTPTQMLKQERDKWYQQDT